MSADQEPTILLGQDGDGPMYVLKRLAATPADALAFALDQGEGVDDCPESAVSAVLMRPLDPIACKIRGVEDGWWDECTARAKNATEFWRIDA
jgi:hypothetical protein